MVRIFFIIFFIFIFIFFNYLIKYIYLSFFLLLIILFYLLKFIIIDYLWIGIYLFYGIDKYSFGLIILCLLIIIIIIYSNNNYYNLNFYLYLIILLLILLILCFYSINYFIFYLFFESRIIPILLLIIGWGLQPERVKAGYYIFLYTIFSSLPLLIILFILNDYFLSLNYLIIINKYLYYRNFNFIYYFFIIFAFIVKLPVFIFHIWLPKAHVEAPLVGSIILAGVILKLGSYGLIRSLRIILNLSFKFNIYLFIISLWGGLILSILCFVQVDLKILVAYSSIIHISFLLIRLLTLKLIGFIGSYFLIISHGICSSGLFYLVNLNYLRVGRRLFILNKGVLIILFPNLSLWWFLICVSNISVPFSLSLFREVIILFRLLSWRFYILIIILFIIFFSSLYIIYLFSYIYQGKINIFVNIIYYNFIMEYILVIIHWFPINLIFLKLYIFN